MSRRSWRPEVADAVFAIGLGAILARGLAGLLRDPGIFWHRRLGRDILDSGRVPWVDALTATRAGQPWIDPYWAWDVVLAAIVDHAGWTCAAALTAVALAALFADVARVLSREGASPLAAFSAAMLAMGLSAPQMHARPHVLTWILFWIVLRLLRDHHRQASRAVWAIPVLMALWANVHGGFLAGLILLSGAIAGELLTVPIDRGRLRRLAVVLALSMVATLATPYGLDLHRHAYAIIRGAKITDLVIEWQPVAFGTAGALPLELMLLAMLALPVLGRGRPSRFDLVPVLVWLHLALGGQRHLPLFGLAAAPVLAVLIDGVRTERPEPSLPSRMPWRVGIGGVVLLLAGTGLLRGEPDPADWPWEGLAVVDRLDPAVPLFHELGWGGMLASESRSGRRPTLDDRFELHGRRAILEYLDAQRGGPGWDALDAQRRYGAVWVRPDRPLAHRLRADPGWREIHRDRVGCVLVRVRQGHGGGGYGRLDSPPRPAFRPATTPRRPGDFRYASH